MSTSETKTYGVYLTRTVYTHESAYLFVTVPADATEEEVEAIAATHAEDNTQMFSGGDDWSNGEAEVEDINDVTAEGPRRPTEYLLVMARNTSGQLIKAAQNQSESSN